MFSRYGSSFGGVDSLLTKTNMIIAAVVVLVIIVAGIYYYYYSGTTPAASKFKVHRRPRLISRFGPPQRPQNNCPPGLIPTMVVSNGRVVQGCIPVGQSSEDTCDTLWSDDALAEARALAQVGALQHDSYGEDKLQSVIEAVYDRNSGIMALTVPEDDNGQVSDN